MNFAEQFELLQKTIVEGDHRQTRKILESLNPQKIPRDRAVRWAELAVRAHLPLFALKTLHAHIYPENSFTAKPTNSEKMTYARALYHLGAVEEALEILHNIDSKKEPEVLFLSACAQIFNWNYKAAISDLQNYMASNSIPPYRKLVAKVNLAAALVNTSDWGPAEKLLAEIQDECKANSYSLLMGNSYELQSQIEIFQGRFTEALTLLNQADELLKNQGSLYKLYVEKWMAVCGLMQNPNEKNLQLLIRVRENAESLGHWSTLRECDLFEAIASKNEALIKKVVMGTPSEVYRQRARKLFRTDMVFRGQYLWRLNEKGEGPEYIFNAYQKTEGQPALYDKPMLLSLFEALTADFYQPSHINRLFKKIYPNEKFNPFSSPARVIQLLRRLDSWFVENKVPIRVRFKKSEFCLTSNFNAGVIVQRGKDLAGLSSKKRQIADLRLILSDKSLSVQRICESLNISKSSALRLLNEALADGKIKKIGTGRSTLYLAAGSRQKKEAA